MRALIAQHALQIVPRIGSASLFHTSFGCRNLFLSASTVCATIVFRKTSQAVFQNRAKLSRQGNCILHACIPCLTNK